MSGERRDSRSALGEGLTGECVCVCAVVVGLCPKKSAGFL